MKDGGKTTFLPDMISPVLLAVARSTQLTIRMTLGQSVTSQSAARIGPGQFSCHE